MPNEDGNCNDEQQIQDLRKAWVQQQILIRELQEENRILRGGGLFIVCRLSLVVCRLSYVDA